MLTLLDVQAIRGSRGDDLIATMHAVADTLAPLHVVVDRETLACRTVQPTDLAIAVLPLGREVVLLRLDEVAREALETFRRFARHVTIDFADGRRRSCG